MYRVRMTVMVVGKAEEDARGALCTCWLGRWAMWPTKRRPRRFKRLPMSAFGEDVAGSRDSAIMLDTTWMTLDGR